jgi:hypothetical protein
MRKKKPVDNYDDKLSVSTYLIKVYHMINHFIHNYSLQREKIDN